MYERLRHNQVLLRQAQLLPIAVPLVKRYLVATDGSQQKVDKGLGVLEWTGSLVPQGLLVKGTAVACSCLIVKVTGQPV